MQTPMVLMVDDNPFDVEILKGALAAIGSPARVHSTANGRSALSYLSSGGTPDVVVLDFNLPGETGLVIAKALRANRSSKALPVVLLSGFISPAQRHQAEEHFALYFEKPLHLEDWLPIASRIHDLALLGASGGAA